MGKNTIKVLIVEDNPSDASIVEEMLGEMGVPLSAFVATDGQIAMRYLERKDDFTSASRPDLVILDLNLPRVNGFDILKHMKSSTDLRSIPIVILTGSLNPTDEVRCRSMGVADYCQKPGNMDEYDTTCVCLKRTIVSLGKKFDGGGEVNAANMSLFPTAHLTISVRDLGPTWGPFNASPYDHQF